MLFEITVSAKSDYAKLTKKEQRLFKEAVAILNVATDRFVASGDPQVWPKRLRVKSVAHAPGILEMTWSFSGPDGRATWEWIRLTDDSGRSQPAIRWRRIGGQAIFSNP